MNSNSKLVVFPSKVRKKKKPSNKANKKQQPTYVQ